MTTDPTAETLAQQLGTIRQQMASAAAGQPTPEQVADWDAFDRQMASRIQKARPGIPLQHAFAALQTLRVIQRMEAPAVVPVSSPPADRAAVVPPPALTEEGRLRARVEELEGDAERVHGFAKLGARCYRDHHDGQIDEGRAVIEGHRFALSVALGLGTGAPWDAIHERVKELRRMIDEAPAALCAECGHPCAVHREGDDPVTPGECTACPDDERHDYRPAPTPPPA